MKKSLKVLLFSISLLLVITLCFGYQQLKVNATETENEISVSYITRSHEYFQSIYLDYYGYSTDATKDEYIVKGSSNAGCYGQNVAANALDRNYNTIWETVKPNDGSFINEYIVEFNKEVEINRLAYATRRDTLWSRGVPTKATFYCSNDGVLYSKIGVSYAEVKNNVFFYDLGQTYTCKYFKIEFTTLNPNELQYANASEIILFKPEDESLVKARNIFTDYKKSVVDSEFKTVADIEALISKIEQTPFYDDTIKANLERAIDVLEGNITFDDSIRQFSTNAGDEGRYIKQVGSMDAFRAKLKNAWEGTDRQATGISANPGQTVKIYVEASSSDPLPRICFTQFIASYGYWREYRNLSIGENVFEVPNMYNSQHQYANSIPGGPIYIVNPYTNKEQSNVKIYIEGGEAFPVFYEGDDQTAFKADLAEYVERYNGSSTTIHNLCEVVSDNIILTVQATRANYFYNDLNYDIDGVCERWDAYVRALHEFEGISLDPNSPYFDERAYYYNINIRVMYPFGAAYAHYEHIGIQVGEWQDNAIKGESFGWGFTHEIGHMLDNSERLLSEVTNNVLSQYNQSCLEQKGSRGDYIAFSSAFFSNDPTMRKTFSQLGLIERSLLWWNIETMYNGYWANLQNLYRYAQVPSGMSKIEKHVYLSSLAAGVDLAYYFERTTFDVWGTFNSDSASDTYKTAMEQAKIDGLIKTDEKKLWYFNNMSGTYNYLYGNNLAIYNDSIKVNPLNISKENDGYLITFKNNDNKGHLGYEIYENGKLIAFTYSNSYLDTTSYESDYIPQYQFIAYDHRLGCTEISDVYQFTSSEQVCRIGDTYYTSLSEAIFNAEDGQTIYLLNDIKESGLTIDKNIVIAIDPLLNKDVTFYVLSNKDIFTIKTGALLKIIGNQQNKIVVYGENIGVLGRFINTEGDVELAYVEAYDIITNTNYGGFIYSNSSSKITISNSMFSNIRVNQQGGIIYLGKGGTLNITSSNFENNYAKEGGVICSFNATISIQDTSFTANSATTAGVILVKDGPTTFINCSFIENNASSMAGVGFGNVGTNYYGTNFKFNSCIFKNNSAGTAGGVVYTQYMFQAYFNNCTITGNKAQNGGVAFANQYSAVTFNVSDVYGNIANEGSIIFLNQVDAGYASKGKLILDDNIFEGEYCIKNLHTVFIQGKSDKLKLEINTTKTIGQCVVKHENGSFDDDFASYISLKSSLLSQYKLSLSEDKKSIILVDSIYDVNLSINGETTLFAENVRFGTELTMPSCDFDNGSYKFEAWLYNGEIYSAGEKFIFNSDEAIVAILVKYAKVDFSFDGLEIEFDHELVLEDNTEINLSNVILPEIAMMRIVGFMYKGQRYSIHDTFVFDASSPEIQFITVNLYYLIINLPDGSSISSNVAYADGDTVNVADIIGLLEGNESIDINSLKAFSYNGIEYALDDSIIFNENIKEIDVILDVLDDTPNDGENDFEDTPNGGSDEDNSNDKKPGNGIIIAASVAAAVMSVSGLGVIVYFKRKKNSMKKR